MTPAKPLFPGLWGAGPLGEGAGDQEQVVRGERLGHGRVQFGGWPDVGVGWGGGTQWGNGPGEGEGLSEGGPQCGVSEPCPPRDGQLGAPPRPSRPLQPRGGSHRLLRWPPFFFFFFLGGGDAELLDQCLVLGEKGAGWGEGRGEGGGAASTPTPHPLPRQALTCPPGARGSRRRGSRSPPGRRPRRRARTPGPARRPRSAAGSPPRCRQQGRSAPAAAAAGPSRRPIPGRAARWGWPRPLEGHGGGGGRIWGTTPGASLTGRQPQRCSILSPSSTNQPCPILQKKKKRGPRSPPPSLSPPF